MLGGSLRMDRITNSNDGFFSLDKEWRFTALNHRAVSMVNKSEEELIGKIVWEEYPVMIGTVLESTFRETMESNEIQRIEAQGLITGTWYNIIIFPLKNGLSVYWQDITAEKQKSEALKNSEERFHLLFDSITQAVWEMDASGANVTDSPSWRNYTGQTYEEILGNGWLEAVHPDDRGYVERRWCDCVKKGENFNAEMRIIGPNGAWKWSNVLAAPVRDDDGEIIRWVGIDIDITERKETIESLTFHSRILSNIHEAVVATDENKVIVYCNNEFVKLSGLRKGEIIGRTCAEFVEKYIAEDSKQKLLANLDRHIIEGVCGICGDGSIKTVDFTQTQIISSKGELKGSVVLIRDVSARMEHDLKRLKKEQEYIEIIDSSTEGSFVQDLEKGEIYYSKEWKTRLGIEQLTPKKAVEALAVIAHPDDLENIRSAYLEACEKQLPRISLVFRARTMDSGYMWILEQSKIIYNQEGKPIKYYGTHMDITAFKQAEEALVTSEQQAKGLVEELRRINNSKNNFIARLSHELRNPLSAIMIGNSIIKQKMKSNDLNIGNAFDIIERQTLQLSRLVDDLLDVTRITQDNIELRKECVECNELVREATADYRPLLMENGISLETEYETTPLYLDADPVRLTQVLGNLLHNAAKFTTSGDKIKVKITCDDRRSNVIITIQDTGKGIHPQFIPLIFEPFKQADKSLDRKNGGLGLGLAIVKGILTLHGGSIDAFSEGIGKGSRFQIQLPLSVDRYCNQSETVIEDEICSYSLRTLIIEDNEDLLDIMVDLLKYLGHEVISASNGMDGIIKANEWPPEVLICDIGLPGMSGYQVADAFRSNDILNDVFLIALTGYAQPEDVERSKEAGFHRHLAKPIQLEMLKSTLAEASLIKRSQ